MTTNKKVALVNPPLPVDIGHHPQFPPLGLAYMAAVLDQNGFEVKIIDCPVNEHQPRPTQSRIISVPASPNRHRLHDTNH